MSRNYNSSQRQPRSANLQVPHSTPPEVKTLRQSSNQKSLKQNMQKPSFINQQRPHSTAKLRLPEQNSFINESPLYSQLYSLNQNKMYKTHQSFTTSPQINQSQDFSRLEISDLKEELVRKSNRIQQLLSNSEKRMQARSISPQTKFTQKINTSLLNLSRDQTITPSKNLDQGQEIKELIAVKFQELEKLKKQSKGSIKQSAQDFKKQFEIEKKKFDNITSKLQHKVSNMQSQSSIPHKPSTQSHSSTSQQLIQYIKQSPQFAERIKQREKIQSPDIRRTFQKQKEKEKNILAKNQSSQKDFYTKEKEDQVSFRNGKFLNTNDNSEDFKVNLQNVQKQSAKVNSEDDSFKGQFEVFQNENNQLWDEINQLNDKNEKNSREINQLKDELFREKQQSTVLKIENQVLKQDKLFLQDQLEYQKTIEANVSMNQTPSKKHLEEKRRAEHFKELTEQLKFQLEESQQESNNLQGEINKLIVQNSKSKQEKETLMDKMESLQVQSEELQNQINDFQELNAQLQDKLRKSEIEFKQLQRS